MRRVTIALLAVFCLPPACGAASRQPAAADAQAFDQTYELVFQTAGQAFLRDQAMPDPDSLDPLLAP
ncbi:MAG: hypothetical protein PHU21_07290, partial [Elusimicrobia bacterium]|nr:hypothetical protein [Elusimicrobiota bacterium]